MIIYAIKNKQGVVTYVGKTKNLPQRIRQHRYDFKKGRYFERYQKGYTIEALEDFDNEYEAIAFYKPIGNKKNVPGRDDKLSLKEVFYKYFSRM